MKYSGLLILIVGFLFTSCSSEKQHEDHQQNENYQAISALGDTLYAPKLDTATAKEYQANLEKAKAKYEAHPDEADNLIWYARREAYQGNYRQAINLYSRGIEKYPDDARFYRHRGHRYITTRQFDKAVTDLKKAATLIEGKKDQIEPDGLPNKEDKPRSTLHTNIWYHLGLAQYLQGNFEKADTSFKKCLHASTNDDMKVAATYWLYMSMRRNGMDLQAGKVLQPIRDNMDIIENQAYHKLLLVFKGVFDEKSLLNDSETVLDNATIGYGLGNWHYINGREDRAKELFQQVYDGDQWNAFGYIAAETDLARLF